MRTIVRSHWRRKGSGLGGSRVRQHTRTKPVRSIINDVYDIADKTNTVYGYIKDAHDFIYGSEPDRYNIALQAALNMGFPQLEAIEIARRLMKR